MYLENQNQACSNGGHSEAISPNFSVLLQILLCQENFLLTNIIKTEVLAPKNVLGLPQTFRPGYGSGLREYSKGKQ